MAEYSRSNGGRIFWAAVIGFLLGIFTRSFVPLSSAFTFFCVLIGLTCVALSFFEPSKRRSAILIATTFVSCALGIVRMDTAVLSGDALLSAQLNQTITIEGTVVREPDAREGSVRLNVDAGSLIIGEAPSAVSAGILVIVPPHSDVSYGDTIRATGILRAPRAFETGEGRQFAYPEYLGSQGIEYELSRAEIEGHEEKIGNAVKAFAIDLKHLFLEGLGASLPEPAAGLAGGITVGDKRSIGEDLTEDFQTVGLMHVIVLSGYNITIVLNAAAWLLARAPLLKHMRLAQLGLNGGIVVLFVLMSGGASSAARAGVMALIAVYARGSSRVFLASRALAVAALLIVLWNPLTLAFDPGFQLSILATLGLIMFTPLLGDHLQWMSEKWALREIVASTLGTQLAVLPLLLYQNGQLPIYALPANLLTLIFMPLAMLFSLIAGVGGILFDALAIPIALPAYLILEYVISAASFISNLPYSSVSIGSFSAIWMVLMYTILFLGATVLWTRRKGEPQ